MKYRDSYKYDEYKTFDDLVYEKKIELHRNKRERSIEELHDIYLRVKSHQISKRDKYVSSLKKFIEDFGDEDGVAYKYNEEGKRCGSVYIDKDGLVCTSTSNNIGGVKKDFIEREDSLNLIIHENIVSRTKEILEYSVNSDSWSFKMYEIKSQLSSMIYDLLSIRKMLSNRGELLINVCFEIKGHKYVIKENKDGFKNIINIEPVYDMVL